MWLIVGLGNPEEKYLKNRHNAGFMAVDKLLSAKIYTDITKRSFKGALYRSGDIFLLKPHTFMNLSGESVIAVKEYFKIEHTIVVHDEIELPIGAIRFKFGGGNAGHNGLKSIDAHIGASYFRVRIGIGKPAIKSMVADYCLSDFTTDEAQTLDPILELGAQGALALTKESLADVSSRLTRNLKKV